jgi:uncharacterized protein (DUF2236 family)
MSEQERPPTEEELRAMYEQELKRVRVEDVVVQTIVSLINLGGRKAGVAPGTEDERDLDQVRKAIEAVKALLPQVEDLLGPDLPKIREAVAQLQMAYAQAAGGQGEPQAPASEPAGEEPKKPEGPGPAQSSGKLWVPGQ